MLKSHGMLENKKNPNSVLPKKIEQGFSELGKAGLKAMKGGEEMANKNLFKKKDFNTIVNACEREFGKREPTKTPWGIDSKVYEGVRAALQLQAVKARNTVGRSNDNKTAVLDVERWDQRIFTLPDTLTEEQASSATVAMSGNPCMENRDYTISGNILNWTSDRTLNCSDALAVRWLLDAGVEHQAVRPSLMFNAVNRLEKKLTEKVDSMEKRTSERLAEIELSVETLDEDYNEVSNQVGALGEAVSLLEDSAAFVELAVSEEEEVTLEPEEEEEMIEAGVKVYHRLSDEGPWIVVQPTVLTINTKQDDKAGETFKHGFVENAWTVQTEDGTKDYPEVVLTTRKPKAKGMSLPKKIALGVGGVIVAAAVVHAPLLLQLIGAIN
jgi:hypothetical protein